MASEDDEQLVTERLADAANVSEDESGRSDDAQLSSCWDASCAPAPPPAAANAAGADDAAAVRQQPPPPQRRRRLEKEQAQVHALTRQLAAQKKLNSELQQQLRAFRANEAVAQLENRNREKQLQIEQLQQENRLLAHQQRLLAKRVEELQDDKDTLPAKHHTLREELRACKESLRRFKDKQKDADEKAIRTHQQAVDLATKNKALLERIRKLEAAAATSELLSPGAAAGSVASLPSSYTMEGASTSLVDAESIIASQEDEITRLQQRVALMKKTRRAEKAKQDHLLQSSQSEVEQARQQLDAFHQQLFAKEKTVRSLYLQMKSLKRAVQDLTNVQQTNQHMQQMVFGRDVRLLGQHSPQRQNQQQQQHHRASQQELQQHAPDHLYGSTTASSHASALVSPRKETNDRVYTTLRQLGFVPSFLSQSPRRRYEHKLEEHQENHDTLQASGMTDGTDAVPPNCVQGRLVPGPPPSSTARRVIQSSGSGRAPRPELYASATPRSRHTSHTASTPVGAASNEARPDAIAIGSQDEDGDFGTSDDLMDRSDFEVDDGDFGDDSGTAARLTSEAASEDDDASS